MKKISVVLVLALSACGGGSAKKGPGAKITLEVGGVSASFSAVYAEFSEYLGGTHALEFESDEKGQAFEGKILLVSVFQSGRLADLVGQTATRDYRQDNPERHFIKVDFNPNFFEAGDKFYQGYSFKTQVTAVGQKEVTVSIDGVFLEAPISKIKSDQPDPITGREVTVRGSFTVPVRRDESK